MKTGTRVNVIGIWQTDRELCNDEECELQHFSQANLPRFHVADHKRSGKPGTVIGAEGVKVLVSLDDSPANALGEGALAVDQGDVEKVT